MKMIEECATALSAVSLGLFALIFGAVSHVPLSFFLQKSDCPIFSAY
jgi:hypothetical protein